MTDITTIDWNNNFQMENEIGLENIKLRKSNWVLFSLTIIIVIGSLIYVSNFNNGYEKR